MAKWRIEEKLSQRQGEKGHQLGHRYFLLALQNPSCLVLLIPKRGLILMPTFLPRSLCVSFTLSLIPIPVSVFRSISRRLAFGQGASESSRRT